MDGASGGSGEWRGGPQLQEPRAKFCAVSTADNRFAVLGGETDEQAATAGKIDQNYKTFFLYFHEPSI